ncbi:MAG: hypothetical protein ACTSVO_10495 [Candidatus Heimdallarchaeaceae archaeon]
MKNSDIEYNNPFKIVEMTKSEFENRGVEIKDTRYDKSTFGSWFIKFSMDGSEYRFVWDGKDAWLILEVIVMKKGRKEWEDLEVFKHNQGTRTKESEMEIERDIIENMLSALDKQKQN